MTTAAAHTQTPALSRSCISLSVARCLPRSMRGMGNIDQLRRHLVLFHGVSVPGLDHSWISHGPPEGRGRESGSISRHTHTMWNDSPHLHAHYFVRMSPPAALACTPQPSSPQRSPRRPRWAAGVPCKPGRALTRSRSASRGRIGLEFSRQPARLPGVFAPLDSARDFACDEGVPPAGEVRACTGASSTGTRSMHGLAALSALATERRLLSVTSVEASIF